MTQLKMEKDSDITAQPSSGWGKNHHWYLGVVSTVASVIWSDTEISSLRWGAPVTYLKIVALAYVSGGGWQGNFIGNHKYVDACYSMVKLLLYW